MSTNNAENFNFKISNLSDNRSNKPNKKKEKRVLRPPTLKFIYDTIDKKDYDPLIKEELKRSASTYPHHGLQRWIDNYDQFLTKARQDVRNRQIEESKQKFQETQDSDLPESQIETNDYEQPVVESFDSMNDEFDTLPGDYDPTA